jgi:hypothetical protein
MNINVKLDMHKAYDTMGLHIQAMVTKYGLKFPDDFSFIKMHPIDNEFVDMVFRYKNKTFAILMDITHHGTPVSPQASKIKEFIKISKENDLIPCVFPIEMEFQATSGEHGYGVYLSEGCTPNTEYSVKDKSSWNLFDVDTNKSINPIEISTDKPVEMSDYELDNFAVLVAAQELEKVGFHVYICSDIPGNYPQILFETPDGQRGWCAVVGSRKYDIEETTEYKKILDKNKKLPLLEAFMSTHEGVLFCVYIKNSLRTDKEHGYKFKFLPISKK